MKINNLYIFIIISGIIAYSASQGILSTGAPASSTGAPNEKTCFTSGCHDDIGLNSGNGNLLFEIENNTSTYLPDQIYEIIVTLRQQNINRFGFEVVALDKNNNNAGEFIVSDNNRTQVINGINNLAERSYITYKYEGTKAIQPGLGQWNFQWKSPTEDAGTVTFYIAGIAANNDATDDGDEVYTSSYNLFPKPNSNINYANSNSTLIIHQNNRIFTMQSFDINHKISKINFFDISGRPVLIIKGNSNNESIQIPENIPAGVFIMNVESNGICSFCKILLK